MTLTLSKTLPARDEDDLVTAARAGDDRAFEELYGRYRTRILRFVRARVHDDGHAEDIAQDVFMAALRRLRATDQEIAFKPWIYEIAKNACIDEFRRGTRSPEISLEDEDDLSPADGAMTLSPIPTPSAAVESKQRLDDLCGAFEGLSDNHHQLLVMREFEGLSYDEIGERLGMTRQMVESSLFRARRKLTVEYEELTSGRRCLQVQAAIGAGELSPGRALGVRQRRRFARHLSHCQACRHVALIAGVDEALVTRRRVGSKIAALFPFPIWRLLRGGGRSSVTSAGHLTASSQLPALAQGAGTAFSLAPATAAIAALAVAGAGVLHVTVLPGTGAEHTTTTLSAARLHQRVGGHGGAPTRAAGASRLVTSPGRAASPAESRTPQAGGRAHGSRRRGRRAAPAAAGDRARGSSPPGAASPAPAAGTTSTGSPQPGSTTPPATGLGQTLPRSAAPALSGVRPPVAGLRGVSRAGAVTGATGVGNGALRPAGSAAGATGTILSGAVAPVTGAASGVTAATGVAGAAGGLTGAVSGVTGAAGGPTTGATVPVRTGGATGSTTSTLAGAVGGLTGGRVGRAVAGATGSAPTAGLAPTSAAAGPLGLR